MKKIILSLAAVLALAGTVKATVLAQYNFTGNSTASSAAPVSHMNAPTSIGVSTLTSGSVSGNHLVFNSSDYSSSKTTTPSKYFDFTVSAASGYVLSFTSLSFSAVKSQGNPIYDVLLNGTSIYSAAAGTSTTAISIPTSFSGQSAHFQIYVYGSNGSSVTFDDITLNGTVDPAAPIPEPVNVALILFGCTFAGVGIGRKFLKKKAA